MSDARSLLRQQRAARRIDHPLAVYTEAGKLSCAICHDSVKSEALWDSHTRSVGHRQRFLAHQKQRHLSQQHSSNLSGSTNGSEGQTGKSKSSTDTPSDEALLAQIIGGGGGQKRKHDEDSDVEMADEAGEEAIRPKRSRQDISSPSKPSPMAGMSSINTAAANANVSTGAGKTDSPTSAEKDSDTGKTTPTHTPPDLMRRISGTPSQGVEIQIPSRPATPNAGGTSATSTPRATPIGRSPLIPDEAQTSKLPPRATFITSAPTDTIAATTLAPATAPATAVVDEDDDWAVFEAEVVNAAPALAPPATTSAATGGGYSAEAVISAKPLTAEEIAAKSEEEERDKRRAPADIELEDEEEEAKRALETEFEEMEELEARVRKLKEKMEAIRRGSVQASGAAGGIIVSGGALENTDGGVSERQQNEDEEDDDDEDDEDDWAGFRFHV